MCVRNIEVRSVKCNYPCLGVARNTPSYKPGVAGHCSLALQRVPFVPQRLLACWKIGIGRVI